MGQVRTEDMQAGATPRQVVRVLTNAEIIALPTTALLLLAAPGANKLIVPDYAVLIGRFSGGGYTGMVDQSSMRIRHINFALPALNDLTEYVSGGFQSVTSFLAQGEQWTAFDKLETALTGERVIPAVFDIAGTENVGLQIAAINDDGGPVNFGGGHASNELVVSVEYRILNIDTGVFE